MRALGYTIPDRLLDGTEMRELEPALADVVEAGIKIDEHWHVHSPSFMRALAAKLAAMGVGLEEGAHVVDVAAEDGRVREVLTTAGAYPADSVVLAAGAWTPEIARMLGVRLPVRPGKGYAFEVDVAEPPRHALMLAEPHVGCSPLGDRIRIAGTMEFSGLNARIDHRRVAGIVRGATRMLRVLDEPRLQNVRSGMRPIAPDGLPIVDRLPRHDNVYVATAYSMLGITLGAPAGEALARLILEGERPPELEPFRASRFAGLGIRGRADARSSAR
jgi:D-amino-acid dehydrogenase